MSNHSSNLWVFETFELDSSKRVLRQAGHEVLLGSRAFDVLEALVRAEGNFVSRSTLKQRVWGMEVSDNAVDHQVSDLRGILGRRADGRLFVETRYGLGWRIEAARADAGESDTDDEAEAHRRVQIIDLPEAAAAHPQPARPKLLLWSTYAVAGTAVAFLLGLLLFPKKEFKIVNIRPLTVDESRKAGPLSYSAGRIFFQKIPPIAPVLFFVPENGGPVNTLAVPVRDALLLDANPGGDRFLIEGYGPDGKQDLWIWSKSTGLTARFGVGGTPSARMNRSWDTLAAASGMALSLRRVGANLSEQRFATARSDPRSLSWHPNSKRIRFSTFDPVTEDETIWEKEIGDGPARRLSLLPENTRACCGVWDPKGEYFVFEEMRDGRTDLWIVDEGRPKFLQSAERLTNGPLSLSFPVFSPNGKTIFAAGDATQSELVSYEPGSRTFRPFMGGVTASDVSCSRDGRWAAYSSLPDHRLWRSNMDGTERTLLVPPPMEAFQPHWSPDGKKICFMGKMPDQPWRAYIVASTGGNPSPALMETEDQGVPSFSADERFVVFGRRQFTRSRGDMDIEVVDLVQKRASVLPQSRGKWSPRWSPDGSLILAQSTNFKHLFLYSCRNESWQELVSMADTDFAEWSADGRYIYFHGRIEGERSMSVYRIHVTDHRLEKLADHSCGLRIEETWSGVAPDNSLLGLRDAKTSQIYALDLQVN